MFHGDSRAGSILPSGVSTADASAVTDGNGRFRITFELEKGLVMLSAPRKYNPLVFRTPTEDSTFPSFYREGFIDSLYDPLVPLYIGKTIDTVIFKVNLLTDLLSTDTIGLLGKTVTGQLEAAYTGRSGSAGSVITLDTITNVLFTDYSYPQREFFNMIFGGRKHGTYMGHLTVLPSAASLPRVFPEADETKREITIFFRR